MTTTRHFAGVSVITVAAALGAATFAPTGAYADALLAGTITSAAGEKMGGVTVSELAAAGGNLVAASACRYPFIPSPPAPCPSAAP